jgi:hypothetical protein
MPSRYAESNMPSFVEKIKDEQQLKDFHQKVPTTQFYSALR